MLQTFTAQPADVFSEGSTIVGKQSVSTDLAK